MRKLTTVMLLFVLSLLAIFPAFAQEEEPTLAGAVVAAASAEEPEFSTLLAAVLAADPAVLEALSDPEAELTVFAPTDEAFAALVEALGEEAFGAILEDQEALTNILLYHVVAGQVLSEAVVGLDGESVETLSGAEIAISIDEDGNVFVNESQVITVDVVVGNSVIHVIDAVLVPPMPTQSIAEIVIASTEAEEPEFTILLTAVLAADPSVVEALSDAEAELTVFAPTDAAFEALIEALGEEAFGGIVADTETLTNILLYHVVAGKVYAADVVELDGEEVETLLEGATLAISVTEDGVFLNETVQVIVTDIEATNGVIHVIDAVLVPAAGE